MRRIISTLFISFMLIVASKATVIFDPAKVDTATLPAGMDVIDIAGTKYLQVVLNGWNSAIGLTDSIMTPAKETKFKCFVKYAVGTSGFTIDKINTFIALNNTNYSAQSIIATGSSASITLLSTDKNASAWIKNIQFAGQETTGWSAVLGDTLTIGKIVTYNPELLFEPDGRAKSYPAGFSLVDIDSETYLKVPLNDWNAIFSLDVPVPTTGIAKWNTTAKFKEGTSGFTVSQVNTFIKLYNEANDKASNVGAASTAEISSYSADITEAFDVAFIQLAGQETTGWSAVVGDTLFLGEISTVASADANVLFDPAKLDTTGLGPTFQVVEIEGVKYLKVVVDGWNTALPIPSYAMGDYNYHTYTAKIDPGATGLAADKMNIFVQPMDGAGKAFNASSAGSADFKTFEGDALSNFTVNQIQFAAQDNTNWDAEVGAIIYISKIELSKVAAKPSPAKNTYTALRVPDDAFIDADGSVLPDEFWANVTAANVDRQALPESETPKITDSKGTMKIAYDDFYLYVLADVEDNTPTPNDGLGAGFKSWENDCIEIFVDVLNRRYIGQKRIDGQQHQLRFGLGRSDADTSAIMYSKVKEMVTWGQVTGGNGWRLEAQIPWPNLCNGSVEAEEIDQWVIDSIKVGKKIAWELSIIDAKAKDVRSSIMNWANDQKKDVAYTTNEFYGELILGNDLSSIGKINNQTLSLFPNPTNDYIMVKFSGVNLTYELVNISGITEQSGNLVNNRINVQNLENGVYFIKVTNENGVSGVNRFIKK